MALMDVYKSLIEGKYSVKEVEMALPFRYSPEKNITECIEFLMEQNSEDKESNCFFTEQALALISSLDVQGQILYMDYLKKCQAIEGGLVAITAKRIIFRIEHKDAINDITTLLNTENK